MKIATATPEIHLGDCKYNAKLIIDYAKSGFECGCKAAFFPALSISGSTCMGLNSLAALCEDAEEGLVEIIKASKNMPGLLIAVGFPIIFKTFNETAECLALIKDGQILKILSREKVPDVFPYSIDIDGQKFEPEYISQAMPVEHEGERFVFTFELNDININQKDFDIAVHVCALKYYAGSLPFYLSSHAYNSGDTGYKHICVSSGAGESTDECIYSGLKAYACSGELIEYSIKSGLCIFDTDTDEPLVSETDSIPLTDGQFFLPEDEFKRAAMCLDIMKIQAVALGERLKYLNMSKCIIGLSGGLDSTLALVCAVNAFDRYSLDRKGIICVTMPGFGTGSVTKSNALELAGIFGVTLIENDIREQVSLHLHSIGQPVKKDKEGRESFVSDVTFENAQARIRTLILMDMANKENALVVGTGDMSELALGWCTYNGDHMSMYSVNAGVPKSVIPAVLNTYVNAVANRCLRDSLGEIIDSIINTPVSPELLPVSEGGEISQRTEDVLGPYELHDAFLYYLFTFGRRKDFTDLYKYALDKFSGKYDKELILNTLKIFLKRFFSQQFKRSCLPTGPCVFEYGFSPRSGFCMPADVWYSHWTDELEK